MSRKVLFLCLTCCLLGRVIILSNAVTGSLLGTRDTPRLSPLNRIPSLVQRTLWRKRKLTYFWICHRWPYDMLGDIAFTKLNTSELIFIYEQFFQLIYTNWTPFWFTLTINKIVLPLCVLINSSIFYVINLNMIFYSDRL